MFLMFVGCAGLAQSQPADSQPARSASSLLIDDMEQIGYVSPTEEAKKVGLSLVAGHDSPGAMRVEIPKDRVYALAHKQIKPDVRWDYFDGLSFWVKGDGSANWGNIRLQMGDYTKAFVGSFALADTNWHEVRLAWGDFTSFCPGMGELGPYGQFKPSQVDLVAFGNSWNFTPRHQTPGVSFDIDDLKLIRGVKASRPRVAIEQFQPVSAVIAKLKAGQKVTILALGDSLTWGTGVGGNDKSYPAIVTKMLKEKYPMAQIVYENRSMGGSCTAKHRQWLKRDIVNVQPELIITMFGYNELPSGNDPDVLQWSGRAYAHNLAWYLEEVAGATSTKPACIVLSPMPGRDVNWNALDPLAQGVRDLCAANPNITVADANAYFKAMGKENYAKLMGDEAHPNAKGHQKMAELVIKAIDDADASGGK